MREAKLVLGAVALLLSPLWTVPTRACSLVGCIDGGVEIRKNFVVLVTHNGIPLPGVSIEVTSFQGQIIFKGLSDSEGKATVANLAPERYWLRAEFLGIGAAYHCFHVRHQPSREARRVVNYEWGDLAPAMRIVTGRLIDTQPGTGGTPLEKLMHPVTVPIVGARLRLQNAITNETFTVLSASGGDFRFEGVPNGTYVLHVEGGTIGRAYDVTDILVKVSETGTGSTYLLLSRQEPAAGNCGDASLRPSWK